MGSLQDLQKQLKSKEETIQRLERELDIRDELIEQLKSQLDKYQSIVPKSLSTGLANGYMPRKQRAQGISAAPQGGFNLNLNEFKKYKATKKPEK